MAIPANGGLTATGYAAYVKCYGLRAPQRRSIECSNEREVRRVRSQGQEVARSQDVPVMGAKESGRSQQRLTAI
jgi:hypothetical protein